MTLVERDEIVHSLGWEDPECLAAPYAAVKQVARKRLTAGPDRFGDQRRLAGQALSA